MRNEASAVLSLEQPPLWPESLAASADVDGQSSDPGTRAFSTENSQTTFMATTGSSRAAVLWRVLNASMNQSAISNNSKDRESQQGADKLDRNTMAKLAAFLTYCAAC